MGQDFALLIVIRVLLGRYIVLCGDVYALQAFCGSGGVVGGQAGQVGMMWGGLLWHPTLIW